MRALAIAMVGQVLSPPAGDHTLISGFGTVTCATALEPERRVEFANWTLGYWTGLNASRMDQIGVTTSPIVVLAEVETKCRARPDIKLVAAVSQTFVMLAGQHR